MLETLMGRRSFTWAAEKKELVEDDEDHAMQSNGVVEDKANARRCSAAGGGRTACVPK